MRTARHVGDFGLDWPGAMRGRYVQDHRAGPGVARWAHDAVSMSAKLTSPAGSRLRQLGIDDGLVAYMTEE